MVRREQLGHHRDPTRGDSGCGHFKCTREDGPAEAAGNLSVYQCPDVLGFVSHPWTADQDYDLESLKSAFGSSKVVQEGQ